MSGFRCLALESGVRPPSVAVCNGDRQFETYLSGGAKVAAALFETIDEALSRVDLLLEDLDCIAFGRGPGAFTGLRVAAAAAQGLGAGLGIRLCAVSSLAALAQDACERASGPPGVWIAPCLPAGRDKVYLGWYRVGQSGLVSPGADDWLAPPEHSSLPGTERFIAAGRVWAENEVLQASNESRMDGLEEGAVACARAVLRLSKREYTEGRLLEPEEARPVYLQSALGDG